MHAKSGLRVWITNKIYRSGSVIFSVMWLCDFFVGVKLLTRDSTKFPKITSFASNISRTWFRDRLDWVKRAKPDGVAFGVNFCWLVAFARVLEASSSTIPPTVIHGKELLFSVVLFLDFFGFGNIQADCFVEPNVFYWISWDVEICLPMLDSQPLRCGCVCAAVALPDHAVNAIALAM